jgi:hypothetical protein
MPNALHAVAGYVEEAKDRNDSVNVLKSVVLGIALAGTPVPRAFDRCTAVSLRFINNTNMGRIPINNDAACAFSDAQAVV